MTKYYLDTSIWLNLFKKEGDETKGKPYWMIADEFVKGVILSENKEILFSSVVLRELQINLLPEDYRERENYLYRNPKFSDVAILQEDKAEARKLESKYNFDISFYDLVHLVVSKRLNAILLTRDRKLLEIARDNDVDARKPEDLSK